jgi:secretion/DNA translocation related CpaE-like protein
MGAIVLIATADPWLLDGLLRLAAVAEAEPMVARDVEQARIQWRQAEVVLVGADLSEELAAVGPARRPGVVLVVEGAGSGTEVDPYRRAIEIGAQDVATLPEHESWLIDLMASAAEPWAGRAIVLCVVGGRGGSGASTFASMLALTALRRGCDGLLIDGDVLGGGVDLVLGREDVEGSRWPDFLGLHGRLDPAVLRRSLPRVSGKARSGPELAVLSWHRDRPEEPPVGPVPGSAMRSVLEAAVRGFDLVVVDLPRHLDEAGVEALHTADATFLVVPLEVRATAAAARVAAAVRPHTTDLRVVVRTPAPGGLSPRDITEAVGLPVVGTIPTDRRLSAALERGELPSASRRRGPLSALCGRLLTEFGVEPIPDRSVSTTGQREAA